MLRGFKVYKRYRYTPTRAERILHVTCGAECRSLFPFSLQGDLSAFCNFGHPKIEHRIAEYLCGKQAEFGICGFCRKLSGEMEYIFFSTAASNSFRVSPV